MKVRVAEVRRMSEWRRPPVYPQAGAGHHVLAAEQAADFGLQAGPAPSLPSSLREKRVCGRRRLGMVSTTCRWATGAHTSSAAWIEVGAPGTPGRGAFLVAGRAGAALLAGEGHEHLVLAVRAADAGEALVQIAALEEGLHAVPDDRARRSRSGNCATPKAGSGSVRRGPGTSHFGTYQNVFQYALSSSNGSTDAAKSWSTGSTP